MLCLLGGDRPRGHHAGLINSRITQTVKPGFLILFSLYLSRLRTSVAPSVRATNPAIPIWRAEPKEEVEAVGLLVPECEGRLTARLRSLFARSVSTGTGLATTSSRYVPGRRPVVSQTNDMVREFLTSRFCTTCDATLALSQ